MPNSNYTDANARLQYVVEATIFWDIAINIARIVLVTMSEAVKEHPTESTTTVRVRTQYEPKCRKK